MSWVRVARVTIESITLLGVLVAVCLAIAAVVTPQWQVVEAFKHNEIHYHGLWENCIRSQKKDSLDAGHFVCTYRERNTETSIRRQNLRWHDNVTQGRLVLNDAPKRDLEHEMQDWQLATLCLISVSILLGIFGFIFGLMASISDCCGAGKCYRVSVVIWIVLHILAGLLMAAGVICYARKSHTTENRFIMIITDRYEQIWGYSFYLAVISCIIYAVTIAMVVVIGVLSRRAGSSDNSPKVYRSAKYDPVMTDV